MTEQEAIAEARHWVAVRKEVRRHLIQLARDANPIAAQVATDSTERFFRPDWPSNEVRKLWDFPSDLSEERLLELIDK